jgi:hypothetical protein
MPSDSAASLARRPRAASRSVALGQRGWQARRPTRVIGHTVRFTSAAPGSLRLDLPLAAKFKRMGCSAQRELGPVETLQDRRVACPPRPSSPFFYGWVHCALIKALYGLHYQIPFEGRLVQGVLHSDHEPPDRRGPGQLCTQWLPCRLGRSRSQASFLGGRVILYFGLESETLLISAWRILERGYLSHRGGDFAGSEVRELTSRSETLHLRSSTLSRASGQTRCCPCSRFAPQSAHEPVSRSRSRTRAGSPGGGARVEDHHLRRQCRRSGCPGPEFLELGGRPARGWTLDPRAGQLGYRGSGWPPTRHGPPPTRRSSSAAAGNRRGRPDPRSGWKRSESVGDPRGR